MDQGRASKEPVPVELHFFTLSVINIVATTINTNNRQALATFDLHYTLAEQRWVKPTRGTGQARMQFRVNRLDQHVFY